MDNSNKRYPQGDPIDEQNAFGKTWNDAEAYPQTQFNPVTDEFERVSEQSTQLEGDAGVEVRTYSDKPGQNTGAAQDKVGDLKDKAGQATSMAQEKSGELKEKAGQATGMAKEKASEVADQAHSMSDKGIGSAATGLGQAASMLRQQGGSREGTIGTAATKTADTLEQASTYLQDKDTDQLVTDIEAMVRKRPVESVIVAAGIGYLLSKVFS